MERCDEAGAPTLVEIDQAAKAAGEAAIRAAPLVELTLAAFPGARLEHLSCAKTFARSRLLDCR